MTRRMSDDVSRSDDADERCRMCRMSDEETVLHSYYVGGQMRPLHHVFLAPTLIIELIAYLHHI